ncbi:MAG: hypothetical protein QHI38_02000 [Armatimonadota bacterium]|nr:hypothetical protein [Armatimonadota bacterium]
MRQPKVGLLPFYLELYDRAMPEVRLRIDEFRSTISTELSRRGLDVIDVPVCRTKLEFARAVKTIENSGADAIVTLHLAYSPSLESEEALALTDLPIIVLDTTPSFDYGPETDPDLLMYNHGIHGVQDMCNLLIRNGKRFWIEVGHWQHSDVLDRVAASARSARMASAMRTVRVGRIGEPFAGMGDFLVDPTELGETIGVTVVTSDCRELARFLPGPDSPEVAAELERDHRLFAGEALGSEAHLRSIRAGLAVRRWLEEQNLSAFSMNFLAFDRASGIDVVPFLEASKAMTRGIGYAGEGDVLTAALGTAIASVYRDVTFTEMFCPDWQSNRIFVSHMGEVNLNLLAGKPILREMPFPWAEVENPVIAVGRLRGGKAVFVDLAPIADRSFSLIVSDVQVVDVQGPDRMEDSVHGWFTPPVPITDFLAAYSKAGGTHHAVLVYGDVAHEIIRFGEMMGWNVVRI